MRVEVTVGSTTWRTSIFPTNGTFVLPVKKAVRTKVGAEAGDDLDVQLRLLLASDLLTRGNTSRSSGPEAMRPACGT